MGSQVQSYHLTFKLGLPFLNSYFLSVCKWGQIKKYKLKKKHLKVSLSLKICDF